MQVFTRTLASIFGGEHRYVIPLFQRPYVWTQQSQWQPLWEDIVEQVECVLTNERSDPPPHFLGAIVIQQRKSWGDEVLAHDVIDGQQRLTTFQILLAAFRDLVAAAGDEAIAGSLLSMTRNRDVMQNPEVEKFKVWPTSRDAAQFQLVSGAGSRAAIEAAHPAIYKRKKLQRRPLIVEAYLYFYGAIEQWLATNNNAESGPRSRALRRVLNQQLQLVSIELDGQEDSQVIFETLNARGVPLLASDLLRNFIFQRAGGPKEAERLHQTYWMRFEAPDDPAVPEGMRFWEVEERQGRLSRARLDLFVQHYLTMKRGQDILISRLFQEYKTWIEETKPFQTVEAELKDFAGFADLFHALMRPDPNTSLGRFAVGLRILDFSTIYPLVMGLVGNQALISSERDGIFIDLESFLIRRLICGRSSKNYTKLFLQLLRDFEKGGSLTRASFRSLLAAGTGEAVDWPDDATFEKHWMNLEAYEELKPARVELILRRIDEVLRSSKTEPMGLPPTLTIEHVMPQTWQDHWPLPDEEDDEESAEFREGLIHNFGNLTLLTQELNSSVSNGPPQVKLREIAKQSMLLLNNYFQRKASWSEQDIQKRAAALFKLAKKVWPSP